MKITFFDGVASSGPRTTSCIVVLPAGILAGDIMVADVVNRDSTANVSVTDDTGTGDAWALLLNQTADTNGSGQRWWKRATAESALANLTISGATGSVAVAVGVYRGCKRVGSPFGTSVGESNASGDESQATYSTTAGGAFVLHLVACTSNDSLNPGNRTATDPATITERFEGTSTGGSDCSVSHASAERVTAGATGTITWAQTDGTGASIATELIPEYNASWEPYTPDRLRRLPVVGLLLTAITAPVFVAPPASAPDLAKAEYPDRVPAARGLGAARQQFLAAPERQPDPPALSWLASYPDQTRSPSLLTAAHQSYVAPERAHDVDDIDWRARYPDFVYPRLGLRASAQQAHVAPVSPPPAPFPDLSWSPVYPSRATRPTFPTAEQRAFFGQVRWPAPSEGPRTSSTWVSDGSGFGTWANPGNAEFSDNLRSTVSLNLDDYSDGLVGTDWGFAIPSQAVIDGIQMTVELLETGGGDMQDAGVFLFKAGPDFSLTRGQFGNISTTEHTRVYGGPEDKWGFGSITPDDVNAAGFGGFYAAVCVGNPGTVGVDQITLRVYYTIPPAAPAVPALSWKSTYQDIVVRRPASRAQQRAHFAPDRSPAAPAPDLSWSPTYPSFALGPTGLLAASQDAYSAPERQPAPPFSWPPTYPSDHARARPVILPAWFGPEQAPAPAFDGFPWLVQQVQPIPRRARAVPQAWFGLEREAAPPAPDLSWLARYPDYLSAAPSLPTFQQLAFYAPEFPPPTPDIWTPVPPDGAQTWIPDIVDAAQAWDPCPVDAAQAWTPDATDSTQTWTPDATDGSQDWTPDD